MWKNCCEKKREGKEGEESWKKSSWYILVYYCYNYESKIIKILFICLTTNSSPIFSPFGWEQERKKRERRERKSFDVSPKITFLWHSHISFFFPFSPLSLFSFFLSWVIFTPPWIKDAVWCDSFLYPSIFISLKWESKRKIEEEGKKRKKKRRKMRRKGLSK